MSHAEFPEKNMMTDAQTGDQIRSVPETATDKKDMPDVAASDTADVCGVLDWVGMSGIALPVNIEDSLNGKMACQATVSTWVSLDDAEAKGIHMSRLYLLLESFFSENALSCQSVQALLQDQLHSHKTLSQHARLVFEFDLMQKRPALKSGYEGWKSYPVKLDISLSDDHQPALIDLSVTVPYSSTCPCSASLSRQLTEEAMRKSFDGKETLSMAEISQWLLSAQGSFATPHSQRSMARVTVRLSPEQTSLPVTVLINQIEEALQTPVQTAVKREDEQEFARLNGHNLMFCEDAARRIRACLNADSHYQDFCLKVEHQESLHAHDAVAMASKGLPGGLRYQG